MNLDKYFTNDELEQVLHTWEYEFPNLTRITSLGKSFEDRPIWLLTLTNQEKGTDIQKPAIWIDANIHATEIAGTTTVLKVADFFLRQYTEDAHITHLLDTCTIYMVPRINPDGAALAMAANPKFIRSGVRPYPWNERADGLHEEDVDGDGRILQIRIPDPHGDWKISTLNPRLMEKRAPNEYGGTYYRIFPEGQIENHDGFQVKMARSLQGLDFNRNFPFQWRPEGEQYGAGPYPGSEPEIQALINFIVAHPNINIAITFHTYSRVILRPYSTKPDDEMETDDLWVFKKIGEIGTRLTGYRCVSTFHDFKYHPKEVTTGAFDDWMYDHLGIYCFTIELWDLPTASGIKERKFIEWWREHPHEDDVQILQWIETNAPPGSYVDWYAYQHPQLGAVEMGGWNGMYTWRNPPQAFLSQEAERHIPFVVALTDLLPHLAAFYVNVDALQNGAYRLNLVVENTGFLPTFTSEQGKKRPVIRPVRAELILPAGIEVLSKERKQELGHLEGRSNKLEVAAHFSSSPTDNRARVEWVLRGKPGTEVLIRIKSERAGTLELPVKLQ